jgi:hypothetical protein
LAAGCGVFHEPVSAMVNCTWSISAVCVQTNCAARASAVSVFDGVGDGFSGGDEHLHGLGGIHPDSPQPTA